MKVLVLAIVAAAALAAGCGSDATPVAKKSSVPECASHTASSDPTKTARGNFPMKLCQEAGLNAGKGLIVRFAIAGIEVDPECVDVINGVDSPENGHFVTVFMEAETLHGFTSASLPEGLTGLPLDSQWSFINEDGITESDISTQASFQCFTTETPRLVPASKYRFSITFDVSSPHGVLIFNPEEQGFGINSRDFSNFEWAF